MSYPNPLGGVTKRIGADIVTHSCGFLRGGKINLGGRVAFIKLKSNKVVVWSSVPYTEQVKNAIGLLTGQTDESKFGVEYLIVPDREHNMVARQYKAKFPDMKIISGDTLTEKEIGSKIDFPFTKAHGNKLTAYDELIKMGLDEEFASNFEFVYLSGHANADIVTYYKPAKTIFEADVLFNLQSKDSEQYSVASGYPEGYKPNGDWWGYFIGAALIPESWFGRLLVYRVINKAQIKENNVGIRAMMGWDFENCVLSHGNNLIGNAKEKFKLVFGDV